MRSSHERRSFLRSVVLNLCARIHGRGVLAVSYLICIAIILVCLECIYQLATKELP